MPQQQTRRLSNNSGDITTASQQVICVSYAGEMGMTLVVPAETPNAERIPELYLDELRVMHDELCGADEHA